MSRPVERRASTSKILLSASAKVRSGRAFKGCQSIPALTRVKPGVSVSSGAVRLCAKSRSTSSRPLAALAALAALGCASGQGFYFAKPLETNAALEYFKSRRSLPTR